MKKSQVFEMDLSMVSIFIYTKNVRVVHVNNELTYDSVSIHSSASDVKNYLLSRHGIEISIEDVRKHIFHDLAGSRSEDESLDIPEIVSLLHIPYLRKVTSEDSENDKGKNSMVSKFEQVAYEKKNLIRQEHASFEKSIIGDVLKIIMKETTGSDENRPLSVNLLRQIFLAYDEKILSQDEELLKDMVAVASIDDEGENQILLDSQAFAKGE